MIIQLLTTPLGQIATVRERRGTPVVWESTQYPTPELARAAAIAWIEETPTTPTRSATLTIEQWELINHALGVAANVVTDQRGVDASEKYDILSDLLTYDLKVTV